jgi:hypothetical protein
MGVDRHQGFRYSPGLPADEFAEWHDGWLRNLATRAPLLAAAR